MISMTRLLDWAYEAATCFVPMKKLTEEQLDKFDDIKIKLCRPNCVTCKEIRSRGVQGEVYGHAQRLTCHIGITHDVLRDLGGIDRKFKTVVPVFLLELIATILHEIIHILFPAYSEKEVEDRTVEWLNSHDWDHCIDCEAMMKLIIRKGKAKMTVGDWTKIGEMICRGITTSKNNPKGIDWELATWGHYQPSRSRI
jgi:hypothetical protein